MQLCRSRGGFGAPQRDPLDHPGTVPVIADDGVLGGEVVPEAERAGLPVIPHHVLGPYRVRIEKSQERVAFGKPLAAAVAR